MLLGGRCFVVHDAKACRTRGSSEWQTFIILSNATNNLPLYHKSYYVCFLRVGLTFRNASSLWAAGTHQHARAQAHIMHRHTHKPRTSSMPVLPGDQGGPHRNVADACTARQYT